MATDSGVYVFPDASKATNSIDPALLMAMQNGGVGNFANGFMFLILFLWLMYNRNGMFGQGYPGNSGGFGIPYLANQLDNNGGRDLLLQAINGRADAAASLAQMTHSSVQDVQGAINVLQSSIQSVGQQVGMSGLQVQNAVQSGNAAIAQQLCQACSNNQLAIANQTNTLQSQMAANHSANQLQQAQNQGANQLAMCQQTNDLTNQGTANTQRLADMIANQNTMITKQFCDLKERDMQDKIDNLTTNLALERSKNDNAKQTQNFAAMLAPLQAQLNAISAKQPQTITLPFNQFTAVPNWAATIGADFWGSYLANRFAANNCNNNSGSAAEAAKAGV